MNARDKRGRIISPGDFVKAGPVGAGDFVIGRAKSFEAGVVTVEWPSESGPLSDSFPDIDLEIMACANGAPPEAAMSDVTEPARKSAADATAEKGHRHPGSVLAVPLGGELHLQYGHPREVGRNGCTTADILDALLKHLSVFQEPGNTMACWETAMVATKIEEALLWDKRRSEGRQRRGVFQSDAP